MTQEFLQDAIVEDLKQLFSHYTLTNSLGVERAVKIVPQGLPIREGDDEETDAEALCGRETFGRRGDGAGRTADRKRGHGHLRVRPGPEPPGLPRRPPYRQRDREALRT